MILTCPKCATRYFLHDVLIGRAGRMVKCTSCGSAWRAEADGDEPLPLESEAPALEPARAEPAKEPLSALPADKLSQTFRARAQVQRKVREAAATGAIWAGLAAGLVVTLALGAVFRMNVVRMWPKTASAYASVGLPVNTTGLVIELVKAAPVADNGHPAVQVSGVMRNIENRAVAAPPLRVSLLGKDGRSLARRIAPAQGADVQPGETRHFTVSMVNPPAGAHDVEVTFALDAMPRAPAGRAPAPKLRGPASSAPPVEVVRTAASPPMAVPPPSVGAHEAKPLPAGSPYALPAPAKSSVG